MTQETETIEHSARIHIDQRRFESPNPTTGHALYELGGVASGFELFREVDGNREDVAIPDDVAEIRLKHDAHFHSGAPVEKNVHIIVNAEPKAIQAKTLSFMEVVALAFPNPPVGPGMVYTVTYKKAANAPHKGSLLPGDTVDIKNGTIFHVTQTNKS